MVENDPGFFTATAVKFDPSSAGDVLNLEVMLRDYLIGRLRRWLAPGANDEKKEAAPGVLEKGLMLATKQLPAEENDCCRCAAFETWESEFSSEGFHPICRCPWNENNVGLFYLLS